VRGAARPGRAALPTCPGGCGPACTAALTAAAVAFAIWPARLRRPSAVARWGGAWYPSSTCPAGTDRSATLACSSSSPSPSPPPPRSSRCCATRSRPDTVAYQRQLEAAASGRPTAEISGRFTTAQPNHAVLGRHRGGRSPHDHHGRAMTTPAHGGGHRPPGPASCKAATLRRQARNRRTAERGTAAARGSPHRSTMRGTWGAAALLAEQDKKEGRGAQAGGAAGDLAAAHGRQLLSARTSEATRGPDRQGVPRRADREDPLKESSPLDRTPRRSIPPAGRRTSVVPQPVQAGDGGPDHALEEVRRPLAVTLPSTGRRARRRRGTWPPGPYLSEAAAARAAGCTPVESHDRARPRSPVRRNTPSRDGRPRCSPPLGRRPGRNTIASIEMASFTQVPGGQRDSGRNAHAGGHGDRQSEGPRVCRLCSTRVPAPVPEPHGALGLGVPDRAAVRIVIAAHTPVASPLPSPR